MSRSRRSLLLAILSLAALSLAPGARAQESAAEQPLRFLLEAVDRRLPFDERRALSAVLAFDASASEIPRRVVETLVSRWRYYGAPGSASWPEAFAGDPEDADEALRRRLLYGWRDPVRAEGVAGEGGDPATADGARELALAEDLLARPEAPAPLRYAAAVCLARRPGGDVDAAVARLADTDVGVAAMAARQLGASKAPRAVGPLVASFLEREDRGPRIAVLRALGALGDRGAVPALTAALGSGDPHLQRTALEALEALARRNVLVAADRRGLATYAWAIVDNDPVLDVRCAALQALARLAPSAFSELGRRARLQEPWPWRAAWVRAGAAAGVLDDEALEPFLSDPDRRVAAAAAAALAALAEDAAALDVRLRDLARSTADEVLLDVSLRALTRRVPDDSSEQRDALAIARRAHRLLPSHQTETRQAVLDLVAALDLREAGAFLEEVARTSPELATRSQARARLRDRSAPAIPAHRPLPPPPSGRMDRVVALLRETEEPRVRIETERGALVVSLHHREAPFTVLNFLELAESGFYDGLLFHRLIPGFVAQAGCPRGDGWGGPGRSIRCEVGSKGYRRGTLGMALAGQDTGGSQWFLCLEAQPHLDGRYTVFGELVEGWEVLDALVQGDRIDTVVRD